MQRIADAFLAKLQTNVQQCCMKTLTTKCQLSQAVTLLQDVCPVRHCDQHVIYM